MLFVLQGSIEEKEQYLQQACVDRERFGKSMTGIQGWLQRGEELLAPAYDGVDFENMPSRLQQHKDFFGEGPQCQDEMDQVLDVAEHLYPTLDVNDSTTLKESLTNTNHKLANVVGMAIKQQAKMEKNVTDWADYQVSCLNIELITISSRIVSCNFIGFSQNFELYTKVILSKKSLFMFLILCPIANIFT